MRPSPFANALMRHLVIKNLAQAPTPHCVQLSLRHRPQATGQALSPFRMCLMAHTLITFILLSNIFEFLASVSENKGEMLFVK